MDGQMMMNGPMMGGGGVAMMVCMIATALFALAILVAVIVQTVLQAKILREVRTLSRQHSRGHVAEGLNDRERAPT